MGISEQTLYPWAEVPVWLRCLAAFEQARDFQQLSYNVVHCFTVVGFVWKMDRDESVATIVMEGVREYTEMHSACLLSTNSSDRTDCPALLGNKAALPDRAAIPDRGADARLPTQFPTPPNRAPPPWLWFNRHSAFARKSHHPRKLWNFSTSPTAWSCPVSPRVGVNVQLGIRFGNLRKVKYADGS